MLPAELFEDAENVFEEIFEEGAQKYYLQGIRTKLNKMKKLILFVAGLLAIATTGSAQGIFNSGARIVSQSGSYWVVDGNVTIKSESATNLAAAANLKINTGATLSLTGSSVLTVSEKWQNDGTCTANSGSTVTLNGTAAQEIGGANATTFGNLTLNNTAGITLAKSITAIGILDFQNGMVNTGVNSAIIGVSGSITNADSTKYINGKLAFTFSTTRTKIYPIGKNGIYRPLTFQYTGLTGTSIVTAEQIESTIPGNMPSNGAVFTSRYWTLSQTGVIAMGYKVSLDGTGFTTSSTKSIILGDGTTNVTYAATFATPTYTNSLSFNTMGNVTVGNSCVRQTVTFGVLPAKNSCDVPFTVSATGGASRNPVVFTSSDPGVATCSGTNGTTITAIAA